MQYRIILLIISLIVCVVVVFTCGYKIGSSDAYTKCKADFDEIAANLTNRQEQETIHEILGKYQGNVTDNQSYDFETINELFSSRK